MALKLCFVFVVTVFVVVGGQPEFASPQEWDERQVDEMEPEAVASSRHEFRSPPPGVFFHHSPRPYGHPPPAFQGHQVHPGGPPTRRGFNSADFHSVRNSVYDVSTEGKPVSAPPPATVIQPTPSANNKTATFDFDPLTAAFPKRMALRVETQRAEFNACGGFSGGSAGTCCSACLKLGYRRGCWCRTWDCLCYDN